jgi:hypothetical protein
MVSATIHERGGLKMMRIINHACIKRAMVTCIGAAAASAHVKISGGAAGSKDERFKN